MSWKILRDDEYNLLQSGTCQRYWRDIRTLIVKAILGTDMAHHFSMIKETKVFFELNEKAIVQSHLSHRVQKSGALAQGAHPRTMRQRQASADVAEMTALLQKQTEAGVMRKYGAEYTLADHLGNAGQLNVVLDHNREPASASRLSRHGLTSVRFPPIDT